MAGDLRYAWRALMLSPGFCLAAILTLALGIGANTTIFTVVYGVLLKPLPYDAPDRIVRLTEGRPGYSLNVSYPNFIDWRARSHVFNDMAIFNTMGSIVVRARRPALGSVPVGDMRRSILPRARRERGARPGVHRGGSSSRTPRWWR